ncbi:MAG: hypothetical protein ACYS8L_06620 [Planctomycetota bacterium]|jgi:hypothetical protein
MAKDEQYLSYEQVLQELQVNRSRLNQLIREGRLREHVIEGETKFRRVEADEVRKTLEKRPTVVEKEGEEPATDLLDEEPIAVSKEPETEFLGPEEGPPETEILEVGAEPPSDTDLLEEPLASALVERDTEILEEEGAPGEEFELAGGAVGEDSDIRQALAEAPAASETAMETELDLDAVAAQTPAEPEEDLFDFSEALTGEEFELGEQGPEAEEDEIITDILDLGAAEEVPEEDLLSEIMEIQEEQETAVPVEGTTEETEDLTAEITTLEEPTYEESELGEVLEAGEAVEFEEELPEGEEFIIPSPAPLRIAAEEVGGVWVGLLLLTLVFMVVAMLFVVENAFHPEFATPLTSWSPLAP